MDHPTTISKMSTPCRTSSISFLDLPVEIRCKIYHDLCANRKKFPTNLGLLSPAWKSPQPPAALMNTCISVASELMPVYFGSCLFVLDTTTNHFLREEALKWLKKVGDESTAHFHRLRIVHHIVAAHNYECEINVISNNNNKNKEVTVTELKGGMEFLSDHIPDLHHKEHFLEVGSKLINDIEETLTKSINSNGTGALGVSEFEMILHRIDHHMADTKKRYEKMYGGTSRRGRRSIL